MTETGGRVPAVDRAGLEQLAESVGGDREFLRELVDTYGDDAPVQVEQMRQGLAGGDMALVHRAAHTLKSNSASLGATGLAELCLEIEEAARDGRADDRERLRSQVDQMEVELARVIAELDELVPRAAE